MTSREAPEPAPYCSIAAIGRLLDGRMLGQIEIVVAGKRQQPLAVALDPDAVLAQGLGQRAAQVAALQVVELGLRELIERCMVDLG